MKVNDNPSEHRAHSALAKNTRNNRNPPPQQAQGCNHSISKRPPTTLMWKAQSCPCPVSPGARHSLIFEREGIFPIHTLSRTLILFSIFRSKAPCTVIKCSLKYFSLWIRTRSPIATSPCANKNDGCQVSWRTGAFIQQTGHVKAFWRFLTPTVSQCKEEKCLLFHRLCETVTFCFLKEKTHTRCCYSTIEAQSCPTQLKSCWFLNFHTGACVADRPGDGCFWKGVSVNETQDEK